MAVQEINAGFSLQDSGRGRGLNPKADGLVAPRGVVEHRVDDPEELRKLAATRWESPQLRKAWAPELGQKNPDCEAAFLAFLEVNRRWQKRLKVHPELENNGT